MLSIATQRPLLQGSFTPTNIPPRFQQLLLDVPNSLTKFALLFLEKVESGELFTLTPKEFDPELFLPEYFPIFQGAGFTVAGLGNTLRLKEEDLTTSKDAAYTTLSALVFDDTPSQAFIMALVVPAQVEALGSHLLKAAKQLLFYRLQVMTNEPEDPTAEAKGFMYAQIIFNQREKFNLIEPTMTKIVKRKLLQRLLSITDKVVLDDSFIEGNVNAAMFQDWMLAQLKGTGASLFELLEARLTER